MILKIQDCMYNNALWERVTENFQQMNKNYGVPIQNADQSHHTIKIGLASLLQLRLTLNSRSFCSHLSCAEITGICPHTQAYVCLLKTALEDGMGIKVLGWWARQSSSLGPPGRERILTGCAWTHTLTMMYNLPLRYKHNKSKIFKNTTTTWFQPGVVAQV